MPHTHTHKHKGDTHTHTCRSHINSLLLYRPFPFPHAASRLLFVPSQIVRTRRALFVSSSSSFVLSFVFVLVHRSLVGWWYSFLRRPKLRKFFLPCSWLACLARRCPPRRRRRRWYRSHRCHHHHRCRRPCVPCFSLLLLSLSSSSSFQFVVYSSSIYCSDFSNIIHKRFVLFSASTIYSYWACVLLSSSIRYVHIMLFAVPPFVPVSSAILIAAPFYVSPFIRVFWKKRKSLACVNCLNIINLPFCLLSQFPLPLKNCTQFS